MEDNCLVEVSVIVREGQSWFSCLHIPASNYRLAKLNNEGMVDCLDNLFPACSYAFMWGSGILTNGMQAKPIHQTIDTYKEGLPG